MKRKIGTISLSLPGALFLALVMGVLLAGVPAAYDAARAEASADDAQSRVLTEEVAQHVGGPAVAHRVKPWHDAGFTGKGVKIGIIDTGFIGLSALVTSGKAPVPMGILCQSGESVSSDIADCETVEVSGTEVAENIFHIAPEVDYYIATADASDPRPLKAAVDWMIAHEVDIILHSHPRLWLSIIGNPTGMPAIDFISPATQMKRAVDNGIVWVNAAGNDATTTWAGFWNDADNDKLHSFTPPEAADVECNPVVIGAAHYGENYEARIRWLDDWSNPSFDLNMVLKDGNGNILATSARIPNLETIPVEMINYPIPADSTASYCLSVEPNEGSLPPHLFQMQSIHGHDLGVPTGYGSITSPAEAVYPGMLAVGAAAVSDTHTICPRSSRGPAWDGVGNYIVKPDIVGGVATCEQGATEHWHGTGEASAHIAGLAALVRQRYSEYTPAQVTQYLTDNADPRPMFDSFVRQDDADPNTVWGHGFAMLPDDIDDGPQPDDCTQIIGGIGSNGGEWTADCVSANLTEDGAHYARYFTFTLTEETDVTITLMSDDADTYLFLLDADGSKIAENDDIASGRDNNSRIEATLDAGDYIIEATTYEPEMTGSFTLEVEMETLPPPPEPVRYKAISSGANHVCALAEDGSIMCWGDDSEGQVSERPTSGIFTQISSGDNHTCALRADGMVICWGSITVP